MYIWFFSFFRQGQKVWFWRDSNILLILNGCGNLIVQYNYEKSFTWWKGGTGGGMFVMNWMNGIQAKLIVAMVWLTIHPSVFISLKQLVSLKWHCYKQVVICLDYICMRICKLLYFPSHYMSMIVIYLRCKWCPVKKNYEWIKLVIYKSFYSFFPLPLFSGLCSCYS